MTDATLQQRAALVTMKLVREHGGEAIADTAWSVTTASGDPVRESVGAFPSMVLAAGDYVIVAKNRDKVYQRLFEVKPGENTDVEVLTSDVAAAEPDGSGGEGSGDLLPGVRLGPGRRQVPRRRPMLARGMPVRRAMRPPMRTERPSDRSPLPGSGGPPPCRTPWPAALLREREDHGPQAFGKLAPVGHRGERLDRNDLADGEAIDRP